MFTYLRLWVFVLRLGQGVRTCMCGHLPLESPMPNCALGCWPGGKPVWGMRSRWMGAVCTRGGMSSFSETIERAREHTANKYDGPFRDGWQVQKVSEICVLGKFFPPFLSANLIYLPFLLKISICPVVYTIQYLALGPKATPEMASSVENLRKTLILHVPRERKKFIHKSKEHIGLCTFFDRWAEKTLQFQPINISFHPIKGIYFERGKGTRAK